MATATVGSNPGENYWGWDGSMHQSWIGNYFTSYLARMIRVDAFFAAYTGGGAGGAVCWKGTTYQFYQNAGSIGAGNQSTGGGCGWRASTGDVPCTTGESWQFGYYLANGVFCPYHTGGTESYVKASAITAASGGTAYGTDFGVAGSTFGYGTYFIVETYVRRSNAWVRARVNVRRGAGYTTPPVYVWRGSGWTQVGELIRRKELDWKREIAAIYAPPGRPQEPMLLRWDYDRPRYIGVGYPGSPERKALDAWQQEVNGLYVPARSYEVKAA